MLPKQQDQYYDIVRDVRQNKGSILKASVDYIRKLKNDQLKKKGLEEKLRISEAKNRKLQLKVQECEAKMKAYGIPMEQLYPVKGGEDYQFENFAVQVIPSIHSALNEKHYIDSRAYTEPPKVPLKVSEFIEGGSLMFLARFKKHHVLTMGSMNFVERELFGQKPDILLAGVNRSQLGLYRYNERLLAVTNYPRIIIPTHWDNFRLPYGFSQESAVEQKLMPFKEDVKRLSPRTQVIIPKHLGTITIE